MPLHLSRQELFPDDVNPLPTSGSADQLALIADELQIGNEAYLDRLRQFSDLTDNIYPELVRACQGATREALGERSLRVLDLCTGIGAASLALLDAGLAISALTWVDISDELLRRAREVLARRYPRMPGPSCHRLDLLADQLTGALSGPFDLVVTCNAFQHFPKARQASLIGQIHDLLAPNGVFAFASHFKRLRPDWKRSIVLEYQARMRDMGAPEESVLGAGHHIEAFHNYANLSDAYNWLEAAGFGFYECAFRKDEVGIFVAVK